MSEKMNWDIQPGNPEIPGARTVRGGVNFSFAVADDKKAELVLSDPDGQEMLRIPLPADERTGDVSSVYIGGLDAASFTYHYEIEGRITPDPYAGGIDGKECCCADGSQDQTDDEAPLLDMSDVCIYKLHVRGFTEKAKRGVRHKGTFRGVMEKIPYIRDLGFTAVELMPVYDRNPDLGITPFAETVKGPDGRETAVAPKNYWGYADRNYYFAPKRSFASSPDADGEFAEMVSAFHREGMEVYLEMYFPEKTDQQIAVMAVHWWKRHFHVDGFHLMGTGVPMALLVHDPLLSRTKLMFEHVDAGWVYGGNTPRRRNLMEYNDYFEQTARCLLKGDQGKILPFAQLVRRNPGTHAYVNYMDNVNGFTLNDMVTYDWKHNEANGENNCDGPADNFSWNCGVEGPTRKKAVRELRMRQLKNAFLYIFLSQGVPLIMAGDECMNTQGGNNNAYSSDNEIGWTDWNTGKDASELQTFVRKLTAFRKAHPIFRMRGELRGTDTMSCGYPDISFHDTKAWVFELGNGSRTLGMLLDGAYAVCEGYPADDFFYVAYNAHWENHCFALPQLPTGFAWEIAIDVSDPGNEFRSGVSGEALSNQQFIEVGPRSVTVVRGRKNTEFWKKAAALAARRREEARLAAKRAVKERALKDAAAKEKALKEKAAKERAMKDAAAKEKTLKEEAAREVALGEKDRGGPDLMTKGVENTAAAEDRNDPHHGPVAGR